MEEWQDAAWLKQRGWPGFTETLKRLHHPEDAADVSAGSAPLQRLAYDELLANQLALAMVRESFKAQRGRPVKGDGRLRAKIVAALPFDLANSQKSALREIEADISAPRRMLRLLQGDVGSGKTVVALLSDGGRRRSGRAIGARWRRPKFSPASTWKPSRRLTEKAGIRIGLLTGREKGRVRDDILARLASGEIDILIGTHALFQADVVFADLAFAVIDEQHRFGVHQRLALQTKGGGGGASMLVLTATPIPRTLLMTHYGDLEVSKLTEKPAGRKPIVTKQIANGLMEKLIARIKAQLAEGAQVYWVCPLIESSDVSDLAAAEERHAHLTQVLGEGIGLLHGGMNATAKDAAMAAFADGNLKVLVATTVIEVGVNVPNANIMVIEHAERFGLAQLHQLRGRVGRGSRESFCMLLFAEPLTRTAQERLAMMEETEDGFLIAEKDLELRGGGEVLGARQSGEAEFRVAGQAFRIGEAIKLLNEAGWLTKPGSSGSDQCQGRAADDRVPAAVGKPHPPHARNTFRTCRGSACRPPCASSIRRSTSGARRRSTSMPSSTASAQSLSPGNEQRDYLGLHRSGSGRKPQHHRHQEPGDRLADREAGRGQGSRRAGGDHARRSTACCCGTTTSCRSGITPTNGSLTWDKFGRPEKLPRSTCGLHSGVVVRPSEAAGACCCTREIVIMVVRPGGCPP